MNFSQDSFKRLDKPQLPFIAIREALINAICHRDYTHQSGSISIAIYDDRLEIWNMGELPAPLNLEDLSRTPHESIPRNKKIAHVFYIRKFIERWGSGTTRMIELCLEAGLPEPEYFQYTGGFCTRFIFMSAANKIDAQEKNVEIAHVTLSKRQTIIAEVLKTCLSGLSRSELLEKISPKTSSATLKRDLEGLEKMDIVYRGGMHKGTKWFIKNKS